MHHKTSPIWRILALLKNRKKVVLFLVCLVVATAGLDILVPFISQRLIDTFIKFLKTGGPAPVFALAGSAAAILAVTIFNRVVKSAYDFNVFKTVTKLEDELRYKAFEHYLELDALFHHGSSSGQVIGRIERGTTATFVILFDIIGQSMVPPIMIFTIAIASIALKNPVIAVATFLPLPIYIVAVGHFTKKIYEVEQRASEQYEAVSKHTYDVATNVLTVKKFSQEPKEVSTQRQLKDTERLIQYEAERLWAVIENIKTAITTAGSITVLLLAGWLVLQHKSTIGEFVLYLSLQNMAYGPMAQLSVIFPRLRRNIARAERLFQVLDEPVGIEDKPSAPELKSFHNAIEFRHVTFQYATAAQAALKNINIIIPANTRVALVGRSGSGKTTFINLLLRSFDPTEGSIFMDGVDIRTVTQESVRRQIAVVPQEVDLFSRSIAENIAYGRPGATRAQIIEAAKTALADEFILRTEHGYDTVVGERGIKLSGGERQRVGIARAVLRDPKILILDEATSHLDTESERLIQKATDALLRNRTSIIIAHRLSTVLDADIILVFQNGAIEEAGTHEQLLSKSPTYKKLHALQFRDN